MEASWRGLRYLVEQVEEGINVKIRVLSVTWKDLALDLERAIEFDQSQVFRKVYNDEFGTPGGEPFGVLLGDYQLHHRPMPGHPVDDVGALTAISQVSAAAFAPFALNSTRQSALTRQSRQSAGHSAAGAARSNGKEVILLSYPGEAHNLTNRDNQKDFTIRMKQFFDHYLMEKPAPKWMTDGLNQVNKGGPIK